MNYLRTIGFGVALAASALCGDTGNNVFAGSAIVVDHNCTKIQQIPTNWINKARGSLHIAYGHTSHGSQVVDGMTGLVEFMNNRGYPTNLFAWNGGGVDGALDLSDMAFGGWYDLGDPDRIFWETCTRSYLATNPACNVVMWAWCGQAGTATEAEIDLYLDLMDGLQRDYTNVIFVHMTGHLDGWGPEEGYVNVRNNQIRNHCLSHGDVLYDFADIESYDPDGLTNYMLLYANEACWYGPTGSQNWALDWQSSHTDGVDWFNCTSWHTYPLNANQKAYAAWWLWARLAGWQGLTADIPCLGLRMEPTGEPAMDYIQPQSISSSAFALEASQDLQEWKPVLPENIYTRIQAISNNWQRIDLQVTNGLPSGQNFFRLRSTIE